MTTLTQDRPTPYREGIEVEYPVAASAKVYAGSLVCVNAQGFAAPAADASGFHFIGVAMEQVDNAAGEDGDKVVRLRRTGVFEFDAASITQAMVGNPMYAVDDHTFDDDGGTHQVRVGVLVKFQSATRGWVDIAR
jgi:hypothetical protein